MKKIIDGKKYDTEKASVVAEWCNHYPSNDFKSCEETLYRTDKGNWFLHGEGGAMSRYAEAYGNSVSGGADIIAMTHDEAYGWLVDHGETEDAERYFPEKVEEA